MCVPLPSEINSSYAYVIKDKSTFFDICKKNITSELKKTNNYSLDKQYLADTYLSVLFENSKLFYKLFFESKSNVHNSLVNNKDSITFFFYKYNPIKDPSLITYKRVLKAYQDLDEEIQKVVDVVYSVISKDKGAYLK